MKVHFLFLAILAFISFAIKAQNSSSNVPKRFEPDPNVKKYLPKKSLFSTNAVYISLYDLCAANIHIGYQRSINKKYFAEFGVNKQVANSGYRLPSIYLDWTDDIYPYDYVSTNKIGLNAAIYKKVYGLPLVSNLGVGPNFKYNLYGAEYSIYDPMLGMYKIKQTTCFRTSLNFCTILKSSISNSITFDFVSGLGVILIKYRNSGDRSDLLNNKLNIYPTLTSQFKLTYNF